MLLWHLLVISTCYSTNVLAKMEGFIIGGERVPIEEYPYSAFLEISCFSCWTCGSSIINQDFILTAAHCVADCMHDGYISVSVGNENREKGITSSVYKVKVHESFREMSFVSDIALAQMKTPFTFGPKVQRVILMESPPNATSAFVSGWGLTDGIDGVATKHLKHIKQKIWPPELCIKVLHEIADYTFCAGSKRSHEYTSSGDSGSPLVIKGNIQIGIVSYNQPYITQSLIVYLNVSFFNEWIIHNTEKMYCNT